MQISCTLCYFCYFTMIQIKDPFIIFGYCDADILVLFKGPCQCFFSPYGESFILDITANNFYSRCAFIVVIATFWLHANAVQTFVKRLFALIAALSCNSKVTFSNVRFARTSLLATNILISMLQWQQPWNQSVVYNAFWDVVIQVCRLGKWV